MKFLSFLNEETYSREYLLDFLKKYNEDGYWVVFSNDPEPIEKEMTPKMNLKGVVGYPVKFVYDSLSKQKMLKIPLWASKKYLVIVKMKKGKTLDISEYDGKTFDKNLKVLKNFLVNNTPPGWNHTERGWYNLIFNAAQKSPKNLFRRLVRVMKEISQRTQFDLNALFKKIGYSAIFSPIEETSLFSTNPEIYFLNYKTLKYIDKMESFSGETK